MWPATCLPRSTATRSSTFLKQALSDFITRYNQANQKIGSFCTQTVSQSYDVLTNTVNTTNRSTNVSLSFLFIAITTELTCYKQLNSIRLEAKHRET